MADFLNVNETQLVSFAQKFAVKVAVHDPVLTTGWSTTLMVIAHS